MSFQITSIGTAVPREMVTQDDAARLAVELNGQGDGRAKTIQSLYRRAGVRKRHSSLLASSTNGRPATQSFFSVARTTADLGPTTAVRMQRYEADALDLATRAASAALERGGDRPETIDSLVTVSCTGFSAPGVDIGLINNLGLRPDVARTHIGFMGCHGALNGLRVAAALSHASPAGKVMLCCVELCSIHHRYAANPEQTVANALFSDGAAALIGSYTECADCPWQLIEQFSFVIPESADLMAWRIGDNGFDMHLSPQLPSVVQEKLRPWLGEQLARHGLHTESIKSWAIHPGGPRVLTASADSLNLDHERLQHSRQVLADYGNMSSPTVLFILDRLRYRADSLPCVVLAFGPGLTIEAALIG